MEGKDESQQVEFLIALAKENGIQGWALFADSDRNTALIARNYQALGEYYRLTAPSWDIFQWAFDKHLTYKLADELRIDYPRTFYPRDLKEVETQELEFPVVMKPANHRGSDRFSILSGVWRANDRKELVELYTEASSVADPSVIMIQEMIPGGGEAQFSYAALCQDGRPLAYALAQRKRMLPVDSGSSSYVETIERPEIKTPAERWLEKVNYTGIVEVEFKFDRRVGLYKLLDVNMRAWGWHPLCPRAGVDFPYLLWKLVEGQTVSPAHTRAGVRWTRTPYDVMSALQSIRRGDLSFRDYLDSLRGAEHEMYTLDDPWPAFVEMPLLLKLTWNKFRGR
jgi:D-aspartate ligase